MTPVNYAQAKEQFDNTRKPPRSKKYNDNQRPLRRVSEDWLMLQRDAHSYVYKIGSNEVVRVFEPNAEGEYEVAVRGLYGTFDIHQMWKQTRYYGGMSFTTTTGDIVRLPLNPFYDQQDKEFSALLTFNHSHQLIVEKSWHADIFMRRSNSTDKAKRKGIKQQLDAYVTLQLFKLPTLKASAQPDESQARPFGEFECDHSDANILRSAFKLDEIPVGSQAFAEAFDKVAQASFNMLASKRIYNADNGDGNKLFYQARGNSWYTRNEPDAQAKAQVKIAEIVESITPDEFKTSLVNTLMKFANLQKGSDYIALPQFANTLPRTYYTRKGG
jgi:hypothetical protein